MRSVRLRQIAGLAARDIAEARRMLTEDLRVAAGPLLEPLDHRTHLATFVVENAPRQPAVLSAGFPWVDGQIGTPMAAVPDLPGAWWAETVLPSDTSVTYQYLTAPLREPDDWATPDGAARLTKKVVEVAYADPHNPETVYPMTAAWDEGHASEPPPRHQWESVLTLPDAALFDLHRPGPPPGTSHHLTMASTHLGNSRQVTVWTPPGYDRRTPERCQVLMVVDGEWLEPCLPAERVFANLVASGQVGDFIAVLVHNAGPTTRSDELACNEAFVAMITDELVPLVRNRWPVSDLPRDWIAAGLSLGGLCAVFLGHRLPHLFGNVLAMSPSLWWGPATAGGRIDAAWLTRQIEQLPQPTVAHWVSYGSLENFALSHAGDTTLEQEVLRLQEVLERSGYGYVRTERLSGGHDMANWRRALVAGLRQLCPPRPDR